MNKLLSLSVTVLLSFSLAGYSYGQPKESPAGNSRADLNTLRHEVLETGRDMLLGGFLSLGANGFSSGGADRIRPIDVPLAQWIAKGNYPSAIIGVMAAAETTAASDSTQQQLLLATLHLADGANVPTPAAFRQLLNGKTLPVSTTAQNLAWLQLAGSLYQQQRADEAIAALNNISEPLPTAHQQPQKLLRANALIELQQYDKAWLILARMPTNRVQTAYLRYNLAIALAADRQIERATVLLNKLLTIATTSAETAALKDRVNLTLAQLSIQHNMPDKGKQYLQAIRAGSPFYTQALFNTGWAEFTLRQYRAALDSWQQLATHFRTDVITQQALFAMPFLYSKLGFYDKSASHYQQAISLSNNEIKQLQAARNEANNLPLVRRLLAQAYDDKAASALDSFNHNQRHILLPVIAGRAFRSLSKRHDLLKDMQTNLQRWHALLDAGDTPTERSENSARQTAVTHRSHSRVASERLRPILRELTEKTGPLLRILPKQMTGRRVSVEQIDHLLKRTDEQITLTEERAQQAMFTALDRRTARVNHRLADAYFAAARLYDRIATRTGGTARAGANR
ncbi:MAG: tetratricopeptide repeat protein [Gammaproteobacteria bacterium]|nr:tetratricopeptide repeat protein [Gammaproteobacteria bacterium]